MNEPVAMVRQLMKSFDRNCLGIPPRSTRLTLEEFPNNSNSRRMQHVDGSYVGYFHC